MCVCRYEDLVSRPEPVLRELVTWLGQDWSQDLLHHHTLMEGVATSGMETTADQVGREHVLPQLIVTLGDIGTLVTPRS